MGKAQDLYDEFLSMSWKCTRCDGGTFKFSEVIKWGHKTGGVCNVTCPYCDTSLEINQDSVVSRIEKLGILDRKIVKGVIEYADGGGKLAEDSIHQTLYLKCVMIMKHSATWNSLITVRPLPFVDRSVLMEIYNELAEAKKIKEVDMYEVQAPIPVIMPERKAETITYSGAPKPKKSRKYKEVKKKASQLSLTIGGGSKKNVMREVNANLSVMTPAEDFDFDAAINDMVVPVVEAVTKVTKKIAAIDCITKPDEEGRGFELPGYLGGPKKDVIEEVKTDEFDFDAAIKDMEM